MERKVFNKAIMKLIHKLPKITDKSYTNIIQ